MVYYKGHTGFIRRVYMKYDNENIFAKIIRGEIPSDIVYEDENVMAFRDISPQAPVHILIIPKTAEICMLGDCEEKDVQILGWMNLAAAKVAKQEGLKSFRTVMNSGAGAGQTVYHIHLHLLGGVDFGEGIV